MYGFPQVQMYPIGSPHDFFTTSSNLTTPSHTDDDNCSVYSEPTSVARFMKDDMPNANKAHDSVTQERFQIREYPHNNQQVAESGKPQRDSVPITHQQQGGQRSNSIKGVTFNQQINPMEIQQRNSVELLMQHSEILKARDNFPLLHSNPAVNDAAINSMSTAALNNVVTQIKKNMTGRSNDYRKSERGLSYLFPSLIDQQLSLLDKVRITVLRHKNNYFLGWSDERLKKVDPLVRPKMPVTKELYKEYCHRNAMKYDSNLQFAMESQQPWAREFRERLVRPPNEGGFHSLCEVKQEAGRLWKEYSGRYKMHNVVKAQMDMNNEQNRAPLPVHPNVIKNFEGPTIPHAMIRNIEPSDVALLVPPVDNTSQEDMSDLRSTTSSPGPRLERLTSPPRRIISRSANSSPIPESHGTLSRKRKSSHDSGCASLPSPPLNMHDNSRGHYPGKQFALPIASMLRSNSIDTRELGHDNPKLARMVSPTLVHTTSEITTNQLFAPLPPTLPVVDQLIIWLQRHQSNYFLGWSQTQIDKLNPFLRPLYVVTHEVLRNHVSPTMVAMFDKLDEVMTSQSPWGKMYQERLNAHPGQGGFHTLEEALTEAIEIWTAHCQPKVSPVQEKELLNPGLLKLKDMFRSKCTGTDNEIPNNCTKEKQLVNSDDTLVGLLHRKASQNTPCLYTVNPARGAENKTMDDHESVLDLSCSKNPDNTQPGSDKTDKVITPDAEAILLTNLWRCRNELQELCKDSVACSWQDRLQPHLLLLQNKLGTSYTLPSSVSDCMIDLMLVTLHEKLNQVSKVQI